MKIYNKKVFASGVFMAALGLLNLITSIMRQDLEINTILLIVVLFVLGFGCNGVQREHYKNLTMDCQSYAEIPPKRDYGR